MYICILCVYRLPLVKVDDTHTHTHTHIYIYIYASIYTDVYTHVCIYVYMHVCASYILSLRKDNEIS